MRHLFALYIIAASIRDGFVRVATKLRLCRHAILQVTHHWTRTLTERNSIYISMIATGSILVWLLTHGTFRHPYTCDRSEVYQLSLRNPNVEVIEQHEEMSDRIIGRKSCVTLHHRRRPTRLLPSLEPKYYLRPFPPPCSLFCGCSMPGVSSKDCLHLLPFSSWSTAVHFR